MRRFLVTCGLALAGALAAATTSSAASAPDPSAFLKRVTGVYKDRFHNALVSGEKFESENILEVVPVNADHAYIRMHLEFYNGHVGAIYGIATYIGHESLAYDNGKSGAEKCLLTISWSPETVVTAADYDKTPGCSYYHGARGSLNDMKFKVAQRRDIRYLQRLRDSREFKDAMAEFHGGPPAQ
jgi:hypothetical protein